MTKRKPLFRKPDPLRDQIEVMKQRLSARIPPVIDYAKIKQIMADKRGDNSGKSL